jgi:hypothetical protein
MTETPRRTPDIAVLDLMNKEHLAPAEIAKRVPLPNKLRLAEELIALAESKGLLLYSGGTPLQRSISQSLASDILKEAMMIQTQKKKEERGEKKEQNPSRASRLLGCMRPQTLGDLQPPRPTGTDGWQSGRRNTNSPSRGSRTR